jgi:hypothetical protein
MTEERLQVRLRGGYLANEQRRRASEASRPLLGAFGDGESRNGYEPIEARIISGPTPYAADPNRPARPF